TSAPLVTQPSSCPEPTNLIKQRRQIPHRSTPASVRTPPAVSSLEAFRTPASVHPLCPVTGRRPKTLNDSGRSRSQDRTPEGDPSRSLSFAFGTALPGPKRLSGWYKMSRYISINH